jgi:hypothetical protein
VDAILCLGDVARVVDALVGALHADENAGLRNSAVEALIRVGEPAVPALLKKIADSNADVRKFIIDVLGGIGDASAVGALVAALEDPDENVRSAAAENLGVIGGEAAVGALRENLDRDDLLLQYTSLQALARIGRGIPLENLTPLLDRPLLRKVVFECLAHVPELRAVDLLLEGMRDRSRASRAAPPCRSCESRDRTRSPGSSRGSRGMRGPGRRQRAVEDLRTPSLHRRIGLCRSSFLGGRPPCSALSAAEDERAGLRHGRAGRDGEAVQVLWSGTTRWREPRDHLRGARGPGRCRPRDAGDRSPDPMPEARRGATRSCEIGGSRTRILMPLWTIPSRRAGRRRGGLARVV